MDKQEMERQGRRNFRLGVGVFAGGIVLLLLINILLTQSVTTKGGDGKYRFYTGPVLPMTSLSGGETLQVQRYVDFDFSPYAEPRESTIAPQYAAITDSYELTNTAGHAVIVELAYGFQGQLTDDPAEIPRLVLDGAPINAQLLPAVDSTEAIQHAEDWTAYEAALEEHDFLREAAADAPGWNEPVTVYHFTGLRCPDAADDETVWLDVSYTTDADVWFYGSVSTRSEEDTHHRLLQIPTDPDQFWVLDEGYLIAVGGDLNDLQAQGTKNLPEPESAPAEVLYEMTRYESTFEDILRTLAGKFGNWEQYDHAEASAFDTPEILYDGAMKRIQNGDYDLHSVSEVFHQVMWDIRMIYWAFPVELAAGETVTVSAHYCQEASTDGLGEKEASDGFDMATTLGSDLTFSGQSASISNEHLIRIVDQNFGFDPDRGITQVPLDLSVERYYLDVAAVQTAPFE